MNNPKENPNEHTNENSNKDATNRATAEGRGRQTQRANRGSTDISPAPEAGTLGGRGLAAQEDRNGKAPAVRKRKPVKVSMTPEEFDAFIFLGGMEEVRRCVIAQRETHLRYLEWARIKQIEYVYTHATPDGVVFYVGKGQGDRAKNFYNRSLAHVAITKAAGNRNILVNVIACEPGTAKAEELRLINFHLAAGAPLVNIQCVPEFLRIPSK